MRTTRQRATRQRATRQRATWLHRAHKAHTAAMRRTSTRTTAIRIGLLGVVLGACGLGGLPSDILTCEQPIDDGICQQIGAFALAGVRVDREAVGGVREVSVTGVPDCDRLGRSMLDPRLGDPGIAACWEVRIRWQRGGGTWAVVRDAADGQVRLLD
jgi:hypothetical protein